MVSEVGRVALMLDGPGMTVVAHALGRLCVDDMIEVADRMGVEHETVTAACVDAFDAARRFLDGMLEDPESYGLPPTRPAQADR